MAFAAVFAVGCAIGTVLHSTSTYDNLPYDTITRLPTRHCIGVGRRVQHTEEPFLPRGRRAVRRAGATSAVAAVSSASLCITMAVGFCDVSGKNIAHICIPRCRAAEWWHLAVSGSRMGDGFMKR